MKNYIGNNNEINKKKYKKSLPPKLNPDAGNVERNIDMFNRAANVGDAPSSAEGMSGMAEAYDRDSLITKIKEFGKNYRFDKYTDSQLAAMLNRLVDKSNHTVRPKRQDRIDIGSRTMVDDPSYNFYDPDREGEYRVENLKEALNRLDHYCIDNDKVFYDLRSLYEGIKYQLKPEEKQELKRLVDTTNDPDAVKAYIDSKDPNRKKLLQSKGIMEEIDDDDLDEAAQAGQSKSYQKSIQRDIHSMLFDMWNDGPRTNIGGPGSRHYEVILNYRNSDYKSLSDYVFDHLDDIFPERDVLLEINSLAADYKSRPQQAKKDLIDCYKNLTKHELTKRLFLNRDDPKKNRFSRYNDNGGTYQTQLDDSDIEYTDFDFDESLKLKENISDDKYSEVQVGDTVYHKDYKEGTVEKFNYKSTPSQEDTIYVTFNKDYYGNEVGKKITRIFPFPRAFQVGWLQWLNHPDSIEFNDLDIQYTDVDFDESLKLKESSPVNYKKKIFLIRELDRRVPYSMRYKEADIVNDYDNDELILYWVTEEPFTKDELQEFAFQAFWYAEGLFEVVTQIALTYRGISKGFNSDDNGNRLIWIDSAGEWRDEDWDDYVNHMKKVGVDVQADDLVAADWDDSTDIDFDESLNEYLSEDDFNDEIFDIFDILADAARAAGGDSDDTSGNIESSDYLMDRLTCSFNSTTESSNKNFINKIKKSVEQALVNQTRFKNSIDVYVALNRYYDFPANFKKKYKNYIIEIEAYADDNDPLSRADWSDETDIDFDESLKESIDADGWEKPYSWTALIRKDNFILEPRDPYKDGDNDSWHVSQIMRNYRNKHKHHGNFNSKQDAKDYVDKILNKRLRSKTAVADWTDETDVDFDESLKESVDISTYKEVSPENRGGTIYRLFRKVENGKGKWAAIEQCDGKDCGQPFEITYEQARGFEPMNSNEKVGMALGKKLLPRNEELSKDAIKAATLMQKVFREYPDISEEDEDYLTSLSYNGLVKELRNRGWDEILKLDEDTVKQGNKWVNKGKEGTHGKFKTKKQADAQRKAMFANGYKGESLEEDLNATDVVDWMYQNYPEWSYYNEQQISPGKVKLLFEKSNNAEIAPDFEDSLRKQQIDFTLFRPNKLQIVAYDLSDDEDATMEVDWDEYTDIDFNDYKESLEEDLSSSIKLQFHKINDEYQTIYVSDVQLFTYAASVRTSNRSLMKSRLSPLFRVERNTNSEWDIYIATSGYNSKCIGTEKTKEAAFKFAQDYLDSHPQIKYDKLTDQSGNPLNFDKDKVNDVYSVQHESIHRPKKILYVIKDKNGNQLSKPSEDDSELWDRVASMEARGRRGLRVVAYTQKDLEEDYTDANDEWGAPYTYEETFDNLAELTNNFTDKDGYVRCYYEQEKIYGMKILKKYYKVVEPSDGRMNDNEPMSWIIAYSNPFNKDEEEK